MSNGTGLAAVKAIVVGGTSRRRFAGSAKFRFCPLADVAVEIPITRPWELKTGPPLLPGLIGAVICKNLTPLRMRSPPMIPVETVPSSPCGLPSTMTSCPTAAVSESASRTAGVAVNEV